VNRFEKEHLVATIESAIKIRLTAWQKLYSSFAYLARLRDLDRHILPELAPRLRRFARLPSGFMLLIQGSLYLVTRLVDRVFGVDWALYGWALYFERADSPTLREDRPYVNVCLYCGSGHPADLLVRRYRFLYTCPTCDHTGLYFAPFRNCI
jgi:hypothetical protein